MFRQEFSTSSVNNQNRSQQVPVYNNKYVHSRKIHNDVNEVTDKHSGKKVCKMCDFLASSPHDFKRHTLKYHEGGLPGYPCNDCEFKTYSKSELKQHRLTKHEGIRHQCEECEYLATSKYSLRLHNESHHIGIRYSCDKCELKARTMSYLRRHKRDKHGEEIAKEC